MDHVTIHVRNNLPLWVAGVSCALFIIGFITICISNEADQNKEDFPETLIIAALFSMLIGVLGGGTYVTQWAFNPNPDQVDLETVASAFDLEPAPGNTDDTDDIHTVFIDAQNHSYTNCYTTQTKIDTSHIDAQLHCVQAGKNILVTKSN